MRKTRALDVKIEGPIVEGGRYTLVIRDVRGFTHESNPGPLAPCIALAKEYNRRQQRLYRDNPPALAHVRYVEPLKKASE